MTAIPVFSSNPVGNVVILKWGLLCVSELRIAQSNVEKRPTKIGCLFFYCILVKGFSDRYNLIELTDSRSH